MALTPQQRRRQRFNQLLFMQMSMAAYASTKASWTPLELFQNDIVGGWYDPSDFSTMFQDRSGTTPVTAVEQPVGFQFDKSKGLTLGAELVTSYTSGGAFGSWNGMSLGGSTLTASTAAPNGYSTNRFNVTATKWYKVTLPAAITVSGGSWNIIVSYSVDGTTYAGQAGFTMSIDTTSFYFFAPAGATKCEVSIQRLTSSGGTDTASPFTSISVREISGNHRYQSTSAARPTLSARYNLLTKTEQFDDAAWTKTSATITANAITAPDGTTTADLITGTAVGGRITQTVTIGTGGTFKAVFHIKKYEPFDVVSMIIRNNTTAINYSTNYTFSTNNLGNGAATTSVAEVLSDGWVRVTVTASTAFTSGDSVIVYLYAGLTSNQEAVYGWGLDLRSTNDGVGLPAYQRVNTSTDYDTSGFPMYLRYDGTDDFMQTASVDFSGTDKITVFAGVRKLSDAAYGTVCELSTILATNMGTFGLFTPNSTNWEMQLHGNSTLASYSRYLPATYAAPITSTLSVSMNLSGATVADKLIPRVNSVVEQEGLLDINNGVGGGNFGNYALYFGARAGTSLFLNGREYQTIIRGAASTATEIAAAELYVNNRTRAY